TTLAQGRQVAQSVVNGLGSENRISVAASAALPYVLPQADGLRGTIAALAPRELYPRTEGAFTCEQGPVARLDGGCEYVVVGHSERRHQLGETDAFINRKLRAALAAGLRVIFCVGETLAEREASQTEAVLSSQLGGGLAKVLPENLAKMVVAYEPVWAIGTGRNATPEQAQQAHNFIRGQIAAQFGEEAARTLPIQYGGSVKPE